MAKDPTKIDFKKENPFMEESQNPVDLLAKARELIE